ncbi:hypothetical protein DEJ30_16010 [Curtobacterium sp. MCPF17_003]|nr:hypothetical protein DEJ30_16010 [Curtobacterium sp. MCPF17_003]
MSLVCGLAEVVEVSRVDDDVVIVFAREAEQVGKGRALLVVGACVRFQRNHRVGVEQEGE